MCINSTKDRVTVDRSDRCFIITNNLYIKKGHSVTLFTLVVNEMLACQTHVDHLKNFGRLLFLMK